MKMICGGFWLGERAGGAEVYISPSLEVSTQYVEITGTLQAGETGEGPAYLGNDPYTEMITEAEIKVEGYNGPNSGYGYDPFEEFVKFEEEEVKKERKTNRARERSVCYQQQMKWHLRCGVSAI